MLEMPGGVEIKGKIRILLVTAALVVAVDQVTKAAIMMRLLENQLIEVIPGFFNIVFFMNPGAAFGILTDGGVLKTLTLVAISAAALVVVILLIRQARDRLFIFALSLIAGGAVGNLIDRIRFGEVVDFLDFQLWGYHWPAFNAADSAITVGVVLALYSYYFRDHGKGA